MGWGDSETQEHRTRLVYLARLSGLLHDIGHAPFSHTGEADLFPEGVRHEQHSASIIKNTEIGRIINDCCGDLGVTSDLVADVVNSQATMPEGFVQELISSPWDVDKMDYLLRDSHYCGVQYGTYDINRLLNTLTLDNEDPGGGLKLAIDEGGLHALEGFVLARYFMFTQVYFHDVRRAFDIVLTEFITELLKEFYPTGRYPTPEDIEEYLLWDDQFVFSEALDRRNPSTKSRRASCVRWEWSSPAARFWSARFESCSGLRDSRTIHQTLMRFHPPCRNRPSPSRNLAMLSHHMPIHAPSNPPPR